MWLKWGKRGSNVGLFKYAVLNDHNHYNYQSPIIQSSTYHA